MVVNPITRPGQTNGSGADDAQFLRLFSGEVLTQFHQLNKLMPYQRVKTLSSGKSATFPVIGTASAKYHTVGESVFGTDDAQSSTYLSKILSKEREIFVDDTLLAGTFVPDIDVIKNHFDERAIYVDEIATALAESADSHIARTLLAAAETAPDFNSMPYALSSVAGYPTKRNDDYPDATDGASLAAFAFATAELFDTYNIPKEGRFLLVRPRQYYALAAEKDLVNRDWTAPNGDYAQAEILKVAGFQILVTNSLPNSDESGTAMAGSRNDVFANVESTTHTNGYSASVTGASLGAIAFQTGAIGTVKMKELSSESEYFMERQGYLLLSKYMMGHNILRPECAAVMISTTIS